MTEPPTPPIEDEPAGATRASAPITRAPDELEEIERELAADPCHLVRRACQVADYECGAAASPKTDGR